MFHYFQQISEIQSDWTNLDMLEEWNILINLGQVSLLDLRIAWTYLDAHKHLLKIKFFDDAKRGDAHWESSQQTFTVGDLKGAGRK